MDPVALIETALASGAAVGLKGTASVAVRDAYEGLKSMVRARFAGRQSAELILSSYEADPQTWERPMLSELRNAGVDQSLVDAAQLLMKLIDAVGSSQGRYIVNLQGSHGVQVGDGNTMYNTFTPLVGGGPGGRGGGPGGGQGGGGAGGPMGGGGGAGGGDGGEGVGGAGGLGGFPGGGGGGGGAGAQGGGLGGAGAPGMVVISWEEPSDTHTEMRGDD